MADDGTPDSQDAHGRTPPEQHSDFASGAAADDVESGVADDANDAAGPDALAEALKHVAEAREFAVHWAAAEIDRWKLRGRRLVMWVIVGIVALVILLAILATATGMLLWGLASLMVSLLGWPMWAGALAIGGGILLIAIGALVLDMWGWNRGAFRSAQRRYEKRKQTERNKFGRSVDPADDLDSQSRQNDPAE